MEIKLLSCPLCAVAHFESVTILRNALIDVTKKQLPCPVCDEILIGLDKFTIHLFTHTDLEKTELNDTVSNNDSNNNNNENNNIEIQNNATNVQQNQIEIVNNETNKDSYCEQCNYQFTDSNMLEMHKNLIHNYHGFCCHLCNKKFKMHGSLMVHLRVAHYGFKNKVILTSLDKCISPECTQTSASIKNEEQIQLKSPIDNKQWECDVCLKRFTTKYFLKKHKRLHTGEMPYECTLCNKSFTFQQSYHKHMLYHSTDKPHTCSECGRAFKELSTLHNHQRIHSGERPFGCETCGKRFRQRVSYLVHRRIHTGAMPYKCTSCDKSFRYKVSQRTHKCKTQPPGSVVRQFGDLVQKLLQNRTEEEEAALEEPEQIIEPAHEPNATSVPVIETIPVPEVNTDFFGLVMSPSFQITSDQFESLCLSSKVNEAQQRHEIFNHLQPEETSSHPEEPHCSTINEECLKQLLYPND